MKNKYWLRKVVVFLFFLPIAILAFGMSVMFLWNYSMPAAINASPINFWQAVCMLLLAKILFGGLGNRWGGSRQWKNDMNKKLAGMTPEQKEKFRQDWRNRCSSWGRPVRQNAFSEDIKSGNQSTAQD